MTDPFDIDLPSGWDVTTEADRVAYHSPSDDVTVAVAAAVQGIRLHYRIECYCQSNDETAFEPTVYTDETTAAAKAEELIQRLSCS